MLIEALLKAARQIFTAPMRAVLFKTVGTALLLLVILGIGIEWALQSFVDTPNHPWIKTAVTILSSLGLVVGSLFLVPPVSSLVAGLYLDQAAAEVERVHYPADPPGTALPPAQAIGIGLRFAFVVLGVNLLALLLVLLPGINFGIFYFANAYLLSREYFELAALRFRPLEEVKALRRRHKLRIYLAGLAIAALLLVPIVNLLVPIFGVATMVHVHKGLSSRRELLPPEKAG